MILLVIVRRAVCEVCNGTYDLKGDDRPPEVCPLCNADNWLNGKIAKDTAYIRKGMATKKKRKNPGATSAKRQQRGRAQWRQFRDREGKSVGPATF